MKTEKSFNQERENVYQISREFINIFMKFGWKILTCLYSRQRNGK